MCASCGVLQPLANFSAKKRSAILRHAESGTAQKTPWHCKGCVARQVADLEASYPPKACATCGVELGDHNSTITQRKQPVKRRMCQRCIDDPPCDRPQCQCLCGCQGRPASSGQRVCPICSRMVGIGCLAGPCWVPAAGRCHCCVDEDPGPGPPPGPEPDPEPHFPALARFMGASACLEAHHAQFSQTMPRRKFLVLEGPPGCGKEQCIRAYNLRVSGNRHSLLEVTCAGTAVPPLDELVHNDYCFVHLAGLSVHAVLDMMVLLTGSNWQVVRLPSACAMSPPSYISTQGLRFCVTSSTWTDELHNLQNPEAVEWVKRNTIHYTFPPAETFHEPSAGSAGVKRPLEAAAGVAMGGGTVVDQTVVEISRRDGVGVALGSIQSELLPDTVSARDF